MWVNSKKIKALRVQKKIGNVTGFKKWKAKFALEYRLFISSSAYPDSYSRNDQTAVLW